MKKIYITIIAFIIALAISLFIYNTSSQPTTTENNQVAVVKNYEYEVLVASQNIKKFDILQEDSLKWQAWNTDIDSDFEYIYREKNSTETIEYEGSVLTTAVVKSQPISNNILLSKKDGGFLANVISPNKRAISIPIRQEFNGVSGLVFPDDIVDVILSYIVKDSSDSGETECYITNTIAQNVRVLATDLLLDNAFTIPKEEGIKSVNSEQAPAESITLELTPQEAEKVILALSLGEITLSLHGISKNEIVRRDPITQKIFATPMPNYAANCGVVSSGSIFRGN